MALCRMQRNPKKRPITSRRKLAKSVFYVVCSCVFAGGALRMQKQHSTPFITPVLTWIGLFCTEHRGKVANLVCPYHSGHTI